MNRGFEGARLPRQAPLALLALALAVPAAAQSPAAPAAPAAPPMARPAPTPVFAIRGFQIDGENPIGTDEANRVLAPFVRQDATLETLQQATAALEAALRARGFGLHRVALPPQEVGATVRLNIVKFAIGKVEIEGARLYDEGNIRRTLPELREGESPNFKRLAVQTAIANENPNKQIQVGLRESEQPDRIDATITVREQRPWTFGVGLSNAGTAETGRDRFSVTAGHTNLFNLDHQFIGAYTTSLDRTDDVKQLGLSYRVPVYSWGGVIGASYTRSDVVGTFGPFSSTGAGHTFGVNYTMYLPPEGGRRSYVTFGIEDKLFEASLLNGVFQTNRDRRSRPVTLGYTARTESDAAVTGYNIELAVNTGLGEHNTQAAYQSEDLLRTRIYDEKWVALRGGASYSSQFAEEWTWLARTQFQYSPDVLFSGEQFGLGGLGSVRGTHIDRPITGDSGLVATVEANTPEILPGLRGLGFVDFGFLANNKRYTPAKPAWDHLASVGFGLRYSQGVFAASAEYGQIVQGSRATLGGNQNAPRKGDDRFYVSVSLRF